MATVAVVLALGSVEADRTVSDAVIRKLGWIYSGGPEGARGVLSTIAASVMGVAGTTFSITIAVLSLAAGQYGPHLLRGFMRDRGNQVVLGAFTSTFLYCLLVLRTVRGTDETTYVPHLSVTIGVVLAVVNVGTLIYFINHIAESIQVSRIITSTGEEIDRAIDRLFPEKIGHPEGTELPPSQEPLTIFATRNGYVKAVDQSAIVNGAIDHDGIVKLVARPGDHIVAGMPLLAVWRMDQEAGESLREAYTISRSRTTLQDLEYALMQPAEIAVRALSPGINDPFTAIEALDRITVSMCRLAGREQPPANRYDDERRLRVTADPHPYDQLVQAAFGHIGHAAKGQPAVQQRLRRSLDLVLSRTSDQGFRAALGNLRLGLEND